MARLIASLVGIAPDGQPTSDGSINDPVMVFTSEAEALKVVAALKLDSFRLQPAYLAIEVVGYVVRWAKGDSAGSTVCLGYPVGESTKSRSRLPTR